MKKVSVTVQYDEEKLSTIKICMEKKGLNINDEIIKFIDSLYTKQVPAQVRDFFDMKAESERKASIKQNMQPKQQGDKK
ncbi:MAG: DUF6103 family protein [Acetobacter sp.]|nr:DUF6103 family protein [Bacteroides sp.]MCM1340832.1 DUF6103 family protein [Acetobacter sp.]MCM1432611.1 DUF6103 family protein [Clostridiales bacterium]